MKLGGSFSGVGEAEPHAQERSGQGQRARPAHRSRRTRDGAGRTGSSGTSARCRTTRASLLTNGTCQPLDVAAGEAQHGRQQGQDAAMVTRTASTTVKANPFMEDWPISRMPSMETTTVSPANKTARPAVAMAVSGRRPWLLTVGEAAAEPRDDEQGVVDPDPERDHGGGRRAPSPGRRPRDAAPRRAPPRRRGRTAR